MKRMESIKVSQRIIMQTPFLFGSETHCTPVSSGLIWVTALCFRRFSQQLSRSTHRVHNRGRLLYAASETCLPSVTVLRLTSGSRASPRMWRWPATCSPTAQLNSSNNTSHPEAQAEQEAEAKRMTAPVTSSSSPTSQLSPARTRLSPRRQETTISKAQRRAKPPPPARAVGAGGRLSPTPPGQSTPWGGGGGEPNSPTAKYLQHKT